MYGASGALNIHVLHAGPPIIGLSAAVVNIFFAGNIDTDNVRAIVRVPLGIGSYVDSVSTFQGGGGSEFALQTWAFTFDFSAFTNGPPQTLSFFFDSAGESNSSLDAISIEYLGLPVPAPGAALALGLLGVTRRRRR